MLIAAARTKLYKRFNNSKEKMLDLSKPGKDDFLLGLT